VTQQPSGRPNEPITAGMNMGPGPGADVLSQPPADDREAVLSFLATMYGNQDALEMLRGIRDQSAAASAVPAGPAQLSAAPQIAPPPMSPAGSDSLPGGGGQPLGQFLLGDPTQPTADQPVPEAQAPQGPSQPPPPGP
jgi:hypothetical protein